MILEPVAGGEHSLGVCGPLEKAAHDRHGLYVLDIVQGHL
jgi:hypothetical protein